MKLAVQTVACIHQRHATSRTYSSIPCRCSPQSSRRDLQIHARTGFVRARPTMAGGEDVEAKGSIKSTQHVTIPERLAAWELVTLSAVAATLNALINLDIFEALARAGDGATLTASEIASQALPGKSINISYLERMLRLMATQNVFSESVTTLSNAKLERRYGLTPISKYLIKDEEGVSLAPLALMHQNRVFMAPWQYLHEAVLDDSAEPFRRAHGMNAWEYGGKNPAFDKLFNKSMSDHSSIYMRAILDAYQGFEGVKVLVDVAGGLGTSLSLIVARHPHIKGVNLDQPHVIAACPHHAGVEHVGGDMFASVPTADAIFMKWILHDWDDESNIKLLKNCNKALPAKGKVIAVDAVLPAVIQEATMGDQVSLRTDVYMFAYNSPGAKERTLQEFEVLATAAGFADLAVVLTIDGTLSVLEFTKA